jgi:hypothetical protein
VAFRAHQELAFGCLLALLFQCAPAIPRVEILPSGLLVVNSTPFVRTKKIKSVVLCVADIWGVPRDRLLTLTVDLRNGYAVHCGPTIAGGCYDPVEHKITVAAQPSSEPGTYDWPHTLVHEAQHWARHVLTGDAGSNAAVDLPAGWCW